jgi:hypothetical protein
MVPFFRQQQLFDRPVADGFSKNFIDRLPHPR